MTELTYSTFRSRLLAFIINFVPFGLLALINKFIIFPASESAADIADIIFYIFSLFYYIFLQYRYGQTLGKWVMNLKIVKNETAKKVSLRQILIREILCITVVLFSCIDSIVTYAEPDTDLAYTTFISLLLLLAPALYMIADILTLLSHSKRRALHDLLAKTVVITEIPGRK
ncbi:RDD family protein [Niabella beijingensis]|uniref:RDD family protein n=1 Tax=Niabella beijingensis TaxID=2872700 RepID=UPI001CBA6DEA|nr:RDD family protein [Niabella beijingensis]MBZ4192002.1 RDD family protein [Niabella beijingensis]